MGFADIFAKREIVPMVITQTRIGQIDEREIKSDVREVIKMVRRVNIEWSDGTEVSFDGKIVSVDDSMVIIKDESGNDSRTAYAFRNIGENKMLYASEEMEEE